jgi:hypothetical protein
VAQEGSGNGCFIWFVLILMILRACHYSERIEDLERRVQLLDGQGGYWSERVEDGERERRRKEQKSLGID